MSERVSDGGSVKIRIERTSDEVERETRAKSLEFSQKNRQESRKRKSLFDPPSFHQFLFVFNNFLLDWEMTLLFYLIF